MYEDDVGVRYKSLQSAVLCIGWIRMLSIVFYTVIYILVAMNSDDTTGLIIRGMLLAIIPMQLVVGFLLFFGAIEIKCGPLKYAGWLVLFVSFCNVITGLVGAIYFIRIGKETVHFMLALCFSLMALSVIVVVCHDMLVIHLHKELICEYCCPETEVEPRCCH